MAVRLRRGPSAAARGAVEQQCSASGVALQVGEAARLILQIRDDLERSRRRRDPEAQREPEESEDEDVKDYYSKKSLPLLHKIHIYIYIYAG